MPKNSTKSINILRYLIRGSVQHLRMEHISLDALERRCVVESVADTLVGNDLEGNEMVTLLGSVALYSISGIYATVGYKARQRCGNTPPCPKIPEANFPAAFPPR